MWYFFCGIKYFHSSDEFDNGQQFDAHRRKVNGQIIFFNVSLLKVKLFFLYSNINVYGVKY